ncbi:DUF2513 domain-containing protein [Lysinibacillus capsici]|uniref:DUF2513 domain-containing protein n=1 Tax=Lysinibacillus capsici TaxID=2115968 RepID=UPI001C0FB1E7|nr:DUF2513 domain-containing protein [Lysinibacillus capsici]MBU5250894.1 DUF2513 domain-containing protein [Lysinibacillus capsici]
MRRDMEYVIKLLDLISNEEYPTGYIHTEIEPGVADSEKVKGNLKFLGHLNLLRDAGYVKVNMQYFDDTPYIIDCRLTWDGNDFLDIVENDTLWARIKDSAKEKGIDLLKIPLESITLYAKAKLNEYLGL